MMTLINKVIITSFNKSSTDVLFIKLVKDFYSIAGLCLLLDINRNRYNYLVRTNGLDSKIVELRKKAQNE
jgi:hypothetical protein